MDLIGLLHRTVPAVLQAGAMLREEFFRPDGPRGSGQKAPIDTEIEIFLRDALRAELPVPFVGEETPPTLDGDPSFCWLVDPHDGTSEFLRGALGSAVSVALLRAGVPVLGVVHAPLSPDIGSDLIAWAEGLDHLLRNGQPVRPDMARDLGPEEIVLVSYRSYARPETNLRRVKPARFLSSNSVAYRLARAAAGDGICTVSRQSKLAAYDYAGGHALLRGAGAAFVDGDGQPPSYGPDGTGGMDKCFAGAPRAVQALLGNDWSLGDPPETPLPERVVLAWPRSDRGLDRAIGCLAGLVLGEGSGQGRLPGQCGPAAEQAILLARALAAAEASPPPGRPAAGAGEVLLRGTPLAIGVNAEAAARLAADHAARAGAGSDGVGAAAAYAAAVATGVAGEGHAAMIGAGLQAAAASPDAGPVVAALEAARAGRRGDEGSALGMLQTGFSHLARRTELAEVVGESAVAGALLGAVGGRAALPRRAFLSVLACRPLASSGTAAPRPPACWADDLPLVAEALLAARSPPPDAA